MHVKKMLEKVNSGAAVTPVEARDAMLGCFVTIHGESLKRGAELLGKSLSDAEAEKHATVIMKGLLGSNWDKPTSKSLHEARIVMDRKMSFSKAPKDLRDMHDQTRSHRQQNLNVAAPRSVAPIQGAARRERLNCIIR